MSRVFLPIDLYKKKTDLLKTVKFNILQTQ